MTLETRVPVFRRTRGNVILFQLPYWNGLESIEVVRGKHTPPDCAKPFLRVYMEDTKGFEIPIRFKGSIKQMKKKIYLTFGRGEINLLGKSNITKGYGILFLEFVNGKSLDFISLKYITFRSEKAKKETLHFESWCKLYLGIN